MKTITLLIIALTMYSCGSNPVGPEIIKDPRQYVWSVDSLKSTDPTMIQSILRSIWGSSEKNVYAVGHGDAENPIMHYDGLNWTEIDRTKNGIQLSYRAECIYGFAWNDIWISGWAQAAYGTAFFPDEVASVIHFNGSVWTQYDLPIKTMSFGYIWGKNSSDLWACGSHGVVANLDNGKWNVDTIKISAGYTTNFFLYSIVEYNGKVYALGYKNDNHTNYFFEKTESGWVTKDSYIIGSVSDKWGDDFFFLTGENRLFSYGHGGVWEFDGNTWTKIITTEYLITGITEYAKDKFIVTDYNGKVYTYSNGILELLKDFGANPYIYGVWANSKECFILANKIGSGISASTLVYHGK